MFSSETTKPPKEPNVKAKLRSFDSGYEHSVERWLDVQRRVKEADELPEGVPELAKRVRQHRRARRDSRDGSAYCAAQDLLRCRFKAGHNFPSCLPAGRDRFRLLQVQPYSFAINQDNSAIDELLPGAVVIGEAAQHLKREIELDRFGIVTAGRF